jgi:hypothetical protein
MYATIAKENSDVTFHTKKEQQKESSEVKNYSLMG